MRWMLVVTVASLCGAGCAPSDAGRSVEVANECGQPVSFLMDGGEPRKRDGDDRDSPRVHLRIGQTETFSVLVGSDQPIFVWMQEPPAPSAVSFPSDGSDRTQRVRLVGPLCEPTQA